MSLVEQCHLHDGARLALHSGSGSQRSIVRGNRVQRSAEGIYFCWGAQHGLYEKNVIEDCNYGMTLGHSDSDNLIRDNDIRRSGRGRHPLPWWEQGLCAAPESLRAKPDCR